MIKPLYLLLLAVFLPGCSNELKGDLTVDGAAFELASCRSGEVYGFVGVELVSKNKAKLRFQQLPSGESVTYYMPPGSSTGMDLGTCGPFTVSRQNSTINDVTNVEGEGELDCTANGKTFKGRFSYANCH